MSAEIASLGLSIDSRPVTTAISALNGLAAAARPAETAASALSKAADAGAKSHAAMSTQAMAAQHSIRSLVEAMASGQPISMALGQQLNHLSYAATGPGGITAAFKSATGSLLGMLNPTTAVIGGIAAVGAGFVYALHSIAETGKAFEDTARSAGTTTDALHGLASAAAFKGIDNADFLKGMDKFGAAVYEAQHGLGALAETFRANGKSAQDFNGYLATAADLIKNASSDQQRLQLLQQMGLPATMDWVRFLSQGADGIKKATDEAAKFNASAEGQLVASARKFDDAWNTTWTNWSSNIKSALLRLDEFSFSAIDKFKALAHTTWGPSGTPANPGQSLISGAAGFKGNTGYTPDTFGTTNVKTNAERQKEISDRQTYISLLGQTASAEQAAQQIQNQADATFLSTGVAVGQKRIDLLKQLAREQALGITSIKASTDAQNVDAATVGMSVGAAAQYAAAQNAINDARRAGRTLTPDNVEQIQREASALGAAAQNADLMRSAYNGLVLGPMQTFTSSIQQGSGAMDALKKSGVSALSALSSKLTEMAAQNLWGNAFGGSSGGGLGGLLSGLFGGGTNANGTIVGAIGPTSVGGAPLVGMNAGGTDNWRGGLTSVNERGGELINLPKGAQIIPHDVSMAAARASGSSGGAQRVEVVVSMDEDGNWQSRVKNISQQSAVEGVNAFAKSPAFVDHVGAASSKARSRRLT